MTTNRLVIGTRGSRLALIQTRMVKSLLEKHNPHLTVEEKIIKTRGDIILDTSLAKIGEKGLFTKEIEEALFRKEIDLAVHSMKDLPTELPPGLDIGAILEREDPRDAFVSFKYQRFADLPQSAIVATSSLRRQANALRHRPDLQLVDIRGNVDTRLRKLEENGYDGMFLAVAGLKRMGFEDKITEILDPDLMLPAIAQGAVGVEIRENDIKTRTTLRPLHHPATHAAVIAERAFLRELEGGCQVPIGALARIENDKIILNGNVSAMDGQTYFQGQITGKLPDAEQPGIQLARNLMKQGAQKILDQIYREKRA